MENRDLERVHGGGAGGGWKREEDTQDLLLTCEGMRKTF